MQFVIALSRRECSHPRALVLAFEAWPTGLAACILVVVGCSDASPDRSADRGEIVDGSFGRDAEAGESDQPRSDTGVDAGDDGDARDETTLNAASWRPLPLGEAYAGRSLREWVVDWARWHIGQDDCERNPYLDADGSFCGNEQNPSSSVFFLEGGEYPTVRTKCVAAREQAVLVPLTQFIADGHDAFFGPPPRAELELQAEKVMASMRDLDIQIEGRAVTDALNAWLVEPQEFSAEIPPEPNYYTCLLYPGTEGSLESLFVTGVFVLLAPPPNPGRYELRYGGTSSYGGFDEVNSVTSYVSFE